MFLILRDAYHRELLKSKLRYLGLLHSDHAIGNCLFFDHALLKSLVCNKEGDLLSFKKRIQLFDSYQQELKRIILV